MLKRKKLFVLGILIVGMLAVAVVSVVGSTGFSDDFSSSVLDPSWEVVSGLGRYSLTDNPGYLRYYLEGPMAYSGGWRTGYSPGVWDPSLTLIRPFEGDNWILKTKVTYNAHACSDVNTPIYGSNGAQYQDLYIVFGEGINDYLRVERGTDWYYGSDVRLMAVLISNGVEIVRVNTLPAPDDVVKQEEGGGWGRYTYWYEVVRNGQEITFRYSYDGTNYVTVFSASLTTTVEATQRVIIAAGVWTTAGSHTDLDYIQVTPSVVPSTIDIDPDTLNLKSKGNWITVYTELPEDYSVEDIDIYSVILSKINGVLLEPPLYTIGPSEIGDYDENDIPDLMVKFDRQELIPLLEVGDVKLIISGELVDGPMFEGTDTIRVIEKGKK